MTPSDLCGVICHFLFLEILVIIIRAESRRLVVKQVQEKQEQEPPTLDGKTTPPVKVNPQTPITPVTSGRNSTSERQKKTKEDA